MKQELIELVKRHKTSSEFLFVEVVDVKQHGMTGDTLLHSAVVRNSLEDVDLLLRSGAEVNAIGDLGNTPLHVAASRGLRVIAGKLLGHGADRNIRNEFGQTAYDLGKLMKYRDVEVLLKPEKRQRSHASFPSA